MYPELWRFDAWGWLSEPFVLHTYGLFLALGFLVALELSARQAEREQQDREKMLDLGFYLLLFGLLGGRAMYIATNWAFFSQDIASIFKFWRGGLVWYGGFIGAVLFMVFYTRRHRLPFFQYVDFVIPYMALGHGLGRLGCFFAGCCHGRPSATAAWGVVFPIGSPSYIEHLENHLIQPGQAALPVYPTQLWEAGFEFFLFALLFLWRPYKYFHGQLFLLWMIFYPVGRAYIEHFRGDSIRGVYILSTSQYISILVACCALLLGIYMFWKKSWTSTDLSKNTVS